MDKTLLLYVDRDYIFAATSTPNSDPQPIFPSGSNEQLFYLYFVDTTVNTNKVEYGYNFKKDALNNRPGAYCNIFDLMQEAKEIVAFKQDDLSYAMQDIFERSKLIADLRKAASVENDNTILNCFCVFDDEVEANARIIFMKILEKNNIKILHHSVPLFRLLYEYNNDAYADGDTLILHALNHDLYYTIRNDYNKESLISDEPICIPNYGSDPKEHALVERIIQKINSEKKLLHSDKAKQQERLHQQMKVKEYLDIIDASTSSKPVQLKDITFATYPNLSFDIYLQKAVLEEKTKDYIKDLISQLKQTVGSKVIQRIITIGKCFQNDVLIKEMETEFGCRPQVLTISDLAKILNLYHNIDTSYYASFIANLERTAKDQAAQRNQSAIERITGHKKDQNYISVQEAALKEKAYNALIERAEDDLQSNNFEAAIHKLEEAKKLRRLDEHAADLLLKAEAKREAYRKLNSQLNQLTIQLEDAQKQKDWQRVLAIASNMLAINPNIPNAIRAQQIAQEQLEKTKKKNYTNLSNDDFFNS